MRFARERLAVLVAVVMLAVAHPGVIYAQEAPPSRDEAAPQQRRGGGPQGGRGERPVPGDEQRPAPRPTRTLPPDQTTQHTLELPGRTLKFSATAGSLALSNAGGRLIGEMAYIAYRMDGADPATRSVTFAFNGGPGSASAWLHLGVLGPWRLALEPAAAAPSAPNVLVPNQETWLDFTDLVLIDPIGTGYSRAAQSAAGGPGGAGGEPQGGGRAGGASREEGGARYFWSVSGDVESISDFIQTWLIKSGRVQSPKFMVGESYGGFRGPRIAALLQSRFGIELAGLVLVSPVLDFANRRGSHMPMMPVNLLPSLAASAAERKGQVPTRASQQGVESYARGEYLADLMRGPRDKAAVDRIVARVTELVGLPETVVRRYGGRIDAFSYNREVNRPAGRIASLYDASVTGYDSDPTAANSRFNDPFSAALNAPLTSAMLGLYAQKLKWQPDGHYQTTNMDANRQWVWGNSPNSPESVSDLRAILALDPRLRVVVAHGFTDLVTPYFADALILEQLPAYGDPGRLTLMTYPGGHMFYSREASRQAFRADVLRMVIEPAAKAVN